MDLAHSAGEGARGQACQQATKSQIVCTQNIEQDGRITYHKSTILDDKFNSENDNKMIGHMLTKLFVFAGQNSCVTGEIGLAVLGRGSLHLHAARYRRSFYFAEALSRSLGRPLTVRMRKAQCDILSTKLLQSDYRRHLRSEANRVAERAAEPQ